jgi:Tfp pilus assembly protein PilO
MYAYRFNRTKSVKLLRSDIAKVTAEQDRARAAETEVTRMSRLIPSTPGTPAFIETLYRAAKESGLSQHEVSTETDKSSGTARPGSSDATTTIVKQRLKISANGSYRNFAEYVRRIQNIERFNRIIDFKLSPDKERLKGTLTIELYSLPVK